MKQSTSPADSSALLPSVSALSTSLTLATVSPLSRCSTWTPLAATSLSSWTSCDLPLPLLSSLSERHSDPLCISPDPAPDSPTSCCSFITCLSLSNLSPSLSLLYLRLLSPPAYQQDPSPSRSLSGFSSPPLHLSLLSAPPLSASSALLRPTSYLTSYCYSTSSAYTSPRLHL
ncbi:unnamed protein product [Dicrocoelium dendriticum]|nr:unnamed protein product [Dicrocoelium dendriticum]